MFYFHGNTDHQNHEDAGRAFTPALTEQQVRARVESRYRCAVCGHVETHPDPAELLDMARQHHATAHVVTA